MVNPEAVESKAKIRLKTAVVFKAFFEARFNRIFNTVRDLHEFLEKSGREI